MRVAVIEPVRVPNSRGTGYETVSPEYFMEGDKKCKRCPVIDLDNRRAGLFTRAGHVKKTKSKADNVLHEFNGKAFVEAHAPEPDENPDGKTEK